MASGQSGYHGYAFRHHLENADLDIWFHENPKANAPELDFETVEAEVVFLVRSAGQWPQFQTEIHFHQSQSEHRNLAASVFSNVVGT